MNRYGVTQKRGFLFYPVLSFLFYEFILSILFFVKFFYNLNFVEWFLVNLDLRKAPMSIFSCKHGKFSQVLFCCCATKKSKIDRSSTPNVMSVGDDSHFAFLKRRDFYYRGGVHHCLRKMRIYCAAVSLRLRLRSKGFAFHELSLNENLAAASMRLICKIPRVLRVRAQIL